jgi:hypothetical protein
MTKTQVPYYNVKSLKNEIYENFGPFIEHGPHWINFIVFTFISENNRYSRCLYKIWNKIISFDMKKNRNLKQIIRKVKKKVKLNL